MRNPKINPVVGDVLRTLSVKRLGLGERHVVSVQYIDNSMIVRYVKRSGSKDIPTATNLREWKQWARDAEILISGDVAQEN